MPKDNEVDEKVMPVAWIVTNGGESCEPWLEYEQSEVDALPAVCIAEPLYSAATVAELRARVDRLAELRANDAAYIKKLDGIIEETGVRPVSCINPCEDLKAVVLSLKKRADEADALQGEVSRLRADAMRYRELKLGRRQPFGDDFVVRKFNRTFGEEEPVEWSEVGATACRLAHKKGVMGSDAEVREMIGIRFDGRNYGPVRLELATEEDKEREAKAKVRRDAIEKAKQAGLSDDDLAAIMGVKR